MIPWYVSEHDVVAHPSYHSEKDTNRILHLLGMDVKYGYSDDGRHLKVSTETEEVDQFDYYHVALSGKRVKCKRYIGVARKDKGWARLVSNILNLPAEFTRSRG